MAEAILADVAKRILSKLIALITEQIGLAWSFKEELRRLHQSVEMIQAVLADAEKRQVREESVRLWLQRLKDIAYEADDLLDELDYCQRYILDILAQCNRPKPIPACTSSLGFSRLYILMLGFIVIQEIIVLHSHTIKM